MLALLSADTFIFYAEHTATISTAATAISTSTTVISTATATLSTTTTATVSTTTGTIKKQADYKTNKQKIKDKKEN